MPRGWKIGVPYPEIYEVNSLGPNFFLLAINFPEKIRRESFLSLSFLDFKIYIQITK
jgi:hypothetical protein